MDPNSGSHFSHSEDPNTRKPAAENGDGLLGSFGELPETYGDNRLVTMPRDPLWFFAYWDATPERLNALRDQVGQETWQKGQAILRVYDMTGVTGDISAATRFFDVDVVFDSRRWYVNVPEAGRTYVTELGFRFPGGQFVTLARSMRINLPQGSVSAQTDSQWMIVNMQAWQKIFEAPEHQVRGSAEIAKMMAQRWEFFRAVYSGSSSRLSGAVPPSDTKPERAR
jgi:hypothetical protein